LFTENDVANSMKLTLGTIQYFLGELKKFLSPKRGLLVQGRLD